MTFGRASRFDFDGFDMLTGTGKRHAQYCYLLQRLGMARLVEISDTIDLRQTCANFEWRCIH
jgi:hypothetical protein